MNKLIIAFSLIIAAYSLQAQTNLDSLYSVWEDESQSDSTRTEAYITYIWSGYVFSQLDSTFILAEEMITFGKNEDCPKALAVGLSLQGVSYHLRADFPKVTGLLQ